MTANMIFRRTVIYLCLSYFTIASASLFSFDGIKSYAKYLDWETLGANSSGNELWNGIVRDCSRKMSFSCIQKNAYTYLDNTFVERDNITVFEGFVLRRNALDYDTMSMKTEERHNVHENLVDTSNDDDLSALDESDQPQSRIEAEEEEQIEPEHREEYKTPLEEITSALHEKTVKFLATRDYELQLPEFFFEGSTVKISPREIDENGALIRVDFGQRGLEERDQGRLLFKKIKKFIQNKLLMSFLALLLIIKLIKVKFMFIIPFLFGIGTAKKLFLKLLLFLVPAFAHVFKLCSSYYTSNSQKYHHHHHQVAHHHHHVPVPVPVPTYYAPHHPPHHEEEYEAYDYAHPHIQLRKDMEELREWGIEPNEEPFEDPGVRPAPNHAPLSPVYPGNSVPLPPPSLGVRPPGLPSYQDKYPAIVNAHAQNLAYNGYVDEHKFNRRHSVQSPAGAAPVPQVSQVPAGSISIQVPASRPIDLVSTNLATSNVKTNAKTPYNVFPQQKANIPQQQVTAQQVSRPIQQVQTQRVVPQTVGQSSVSIAAPLTQSNNRVAYDDAFYGPILERLEDIFAQLRFVEESCRERLICSMYKNPALYSPHSNLVSNELSRDPQELKRGGTGSNSSHRFHRYLSAARLGQDGGDCLRTYPCQINTE